MIASQLVATEDSDQILRITYLDQAIMISVTEWCLTLGSKNIYSKSQKYGNFPTVSQGLPEIQISLYKIVHIDWFKFCTMRDKNYCG